MIEDRIRLYNNVIDLFKQICIEKYCGEAKDSIIDLVVYLLEPKWEDNDEDKILTLSINCKKINYNDEKEKIVEYQKIKNIISFFFSTIDGNDRMQQIISDDRIKQLGVSLDINLELPDDFSKY